MVAFTVGTERWEVGDAAFLHCFFSTMSAHTEPDGWGTRYPVLMRELYVGTLAPQNAAQCRDDLRQAFAALAVLPPSAVVWDYSDRSLRPPWEAATPAHIRHLGEYFMASDGTNLFTVIDTVLQRSQQTGLPTEIN